MARSSVYTDALALEICSRIASGESLVRICKDEHMPDITTVYRWLRDKLDFRQMYVIAREDQADTFADKILEVSQEVPVASAKDDDDKEAAKPVQLDGAAVQLMRLRVDALKWIASKNRPKRYGDRTELVGAGGEPLIKNMTNAEQFEAVRRLAWLLTAAERAEQS